MTRRAGLDPTGFRAALLLAVLAALANGVWLLLDHTAPAWDQAHYLWVTLQYQHAFDSEGVSGLLHAIHSLDPSRGPLFPVLMLPFFALFGASARSGMALNLLLAPVLYLAAGQIAWLVFRNWRARLLAILLAATMPLLVGLFHNAFQDFLLATLATVSVLLLLYSERFSRRWACVGLGVAMGLGTLTKVTFPLFLIGPLLVVAAQVAVAHRAGESDGERPDPRALTVNLAAAAAVYLLLVLPWYLPHFEATREYATSTTSGPLALGAGPVHPLTFHAVASFTANLVDSDVSWIVALAAIVALALNLPRLRDLLRPPVAVARLLQLAVPLAWAVVPYLALASAHNQDVRLMAAAFPAVAVLVAGAIAAIRWQAAQATLVAVLVLLLAYQTLNHTTSVQPGFVPQNASLEVGPYAAVLHLGDEPIGYERLPGPDYATPIVEYMETVARRRPSRPQPYSVCMLESEPLANGNTLEFAAAIRGAPLTFVGVLAHEAGTSLARKLASCDFAIYAKQLPPPAGLDDVRLTLVNREYAAAAMTPRLLAGFAGPRRYFSTGPSPQVQGEDRWISVAGKADRVLVLSNLAPQ